MQFKLHTMILKSKTFKTDKELGSWLINQNVKVLSIERYSAIETCVLPCGAILVGHGERIKLWYLVLESPKAQSKQQTEKSFFDLFK